MPTVLITVRSSVSSRGNGLVRDNIWLLSIILLAYTLTLNSLLCADTLWTNVEQHHKIRVKTKTQLIVFFSGKMGSLVGHIQAGFFFFYSAL